MSHREIDFCLNEVSGDRASRLLIILDPFLKSVPRVIVNFGNKNHERDADSLFVLFHRAQNLPFDVNLSAKGLIMSRKNSNELNKSTAYNFVCKMALNTRGRGIKISN